MIDKYSNIMIIDELCQWANLNRSVYYYKPTGSKGGMKPSEYTYKIDGSRVLNELVVEDIKNVLSDEFITYGYDLVSTELKSLGYIINKKKEYRLRDENSLLLGTRIKLLASEILCVFVKYQHLIRLNTYVWISSMFGLKAKKVIITYSLSSMCIVAKPLTGYFFHQFESSM